MKRIKRAIIPSDVQLRALLVFWMVSVLGLLDTNAGIIYYIVGVLVWYLLVVFINIMGWGKPLNE